MLAPLPPYSARSVVMVVAVVKKLERRRESDVALFFSNLNYRFLKDSATTKLAPSADILEPQQNTKFWCAQFLAAPSFDTDINRGTYSFLRLE